MTKGISRFLLSAVSLLILTATAHAASPPFVAVLNGSQETPSNSSTAVGNGLVILNSAENMITVSLKFSGLSANQTMAHIHGPASFGETGPVLFDVGSSGTTSGTFINLSFAITPQQVGFLRAGLLYFNVHSTAFPNGEIRGQIQAVRNGKIAFLQSEADTSSNLYVMNGDSTGVSKLTPEMANNEIAPVWSPDGSRVAYFQQGTMRIYAVNADGSNKTLIKSGQVGFQFDWSPDGTKIVYSQNGDIFTVSTDGLETTTQLTAGPLGDAAPNWSPDGTKIVFHRINFDNHNFNIFVMNSDGTGQTALTSFPPDGNSATSPFWSPDGKQIAYHFPSTNDIYVMNANGTNQINITNTPTSVIEEYPVWSPDSTKILFYRHGSYSSYPNPGNIYSINPDGTGATLLLTVPLGIITQSPTAPSVQPLYRQRLNRVSDFDGDGGTDFATWRPSDGIWRIVNSFDGTGRNQQWGDSALGDVPVPGDYDGDGRIDLTIFRPGEGNWYIINSFTSTLSLRGWGQTGDVPVPGDYDGDGRTDIAVYRPSEGNWYIINSSNNSITLRNWGIGTDRPVPADYDGDNRTDLAVFRPGDGVWYVIKSTGGATVQGWGQSTDKTVPGDYDGDRKADVAVYRPSEGNWYIIKSTGGITVRNWGASTDRPVPADYDNDGKTDLAVWRPGENTWYIINSATGTIRLGFLGSSGDVLLPAAYVQ